MGENVKHTPGPWIEAPRSAGTHIHADGGEIAWLRSHMGLSSDEIEANARLIAAAPAFLAASEALLIAWQKLIEALRQDDRIEEIEFNEFMALRSAVANARGIHSWQVHKHLQDMEARP